MVSQPGKWEMRSWVQSPVPPPWVHTVSFPAHETGDEGWPPNPKMGERGGVGIVVKLETLKAEVLGLRPNSSIPPKCICSFTSAK